MKYQIILSSDEILTDQEFQEALKGCDSDYGSLGFILQGFKLIYAQNLEGIRKELWDKKEQIEETYGPEIRVDTIEAVEDTFKSIENLFNIGDEDVNI